MAEQMTRTIVTDEWNNRVRLSPQQGGLIEIERSPQTIILPDEPTTA